MSQINSIMLVLLVVQSGCAGLQVSKINNEKSLSCEAKAKPKSLQYLEQQYRCTAEE